MVRTAKQRIQDKNLRKAWKIVRDNMKAKAKKRRKKK